MTLTQQIVTLLVVVTATQLSRWLPLLAFRKGAPAFINYLGRVFPPAIFGMLVVYCYRNVDFLHSASHGLPELIAGIIVAVLQFRFKNMCLSILGGTALYIIMVNM